MQTDQRSGSDQGSGKSLGLGRKVLAFVVGAVVGFVLITVLMKLIP